MEFRHTHSLYIFQKLHLFYVQAFSLPYFVFLERKVIVSNEMAIKSLCCILDMTVDIIDETLNYFKANVFFKNYEIKVCR